MGPGFDLEEVEKTKRARERANRRTAVWNFLQSTVTAILLLTLCAMVGARLGDFFARRWQSDDEVPVLAEQNGRSVQTRGIAGNLPCTLLTCQQPSALMRHYDGASPWQSKGMMRATDEEIRDYLAHLKR